MHAKVLPHVTPPITSWTWHANMLSILWQYPETHDWIFSNYINIYATGQDRLGNREVIDFWPRFLTLNECPFIYQQLMKRKTIDIVCNRNIINFFCEMIDCENYIYGIFNEHFISGNYFPHELFIYGYDNDKGFFYTSDFSYTGSYGDKCVKYEDIEEAYYSLKPEDDYLFRGRGGIAFLSYYPNVSYTLNLKFIKESLICYQKSYNVSKLDERKTSITMSGCYGLSTYTFLIDNIKSGEYAIDPRAIAILRDHKKMLYLRCQYLSEHGLIRSSFSTQFYKIYEMATILLNLTIKCYLKKESCCEKRICLLTMMQQEELKLLPELIEAMEESTAG